MRACPFFPLKATFKLRLCHWPPPVLHSNYKAAMSVLYFLLPVLVLIAPAGLASILYKEVPPTASGMISFAKGSRVHEKAMEG